MHVAEEVVGEEAERIISPMSAAAIFRLPASGFRFPLNSSAQQQQEGAVSVV
jgi:hypothetical protein